MRQFIVYERFIKFVSLLACLMFIFNGSTVLAEVDPMGRMSRLARSIAKGTDEHLNISGYVNGHYMNHNGMPKTIGKNLNKPLFQMREASIFADIVLTDYLIFSTELEMSYEFSSKDTSNRKDRFEALLNYYYFSYDLTDHFGLDSDVFGNVNLRAGRILVPFLNYNENKPNFRQNLMSQPFTAWLLVPVNDVASSFEQFGWSDTGVSFSWSQTTGDQGLFDAKVSVINGLGNESAVLDSNALQLDPPGMMKPTVRPRDGLANAKSDWDEFSDVNGNKAVVVKLSWASFSFPLNLGISWYKGAWNQEGNHDLILKGFHFNYQRRNWGFTGEYVRADVEQTAGINVVTAMGPGSINTSTGDYEMAAWFVEGSYVPLRYGEADERFVKVVFRADDVDTNNKALFTPFDRSRVTLGMEWGFLPDIRFRFEVQRHSLDDFDKAPIAFMNAGGEEHVTMYMASLIAYF